MTMAHSIGKYSMIPLYVLCIALCYPVSGENDQEIKNVTAVGEFGKEAVVTCTVFPENATIRWLFEGKNLNASDRITSNHTIKVFGKEKVDGNEIKVKVYTLKISQPTEKDAGTYTCVISGDSMDAVLRLNFNGSLVSSTKGPIEFNMTEITDENRTLKLNCEFEVYNETKVEWVLQRKKGEGPDQEDILLKEENYKTIRHPNNTKRLLSTFMTKMYIDFFDEQNGIYICRVWDRYGTNKNLTGKTEVLMYAPPVVTIDFAKAIGASQIYLNWTVKPYNAKISNYYLSYMDTKNGTGMYVSNTERINVNATYFILKGNEKHRLEPNTSYGLKLQVETTRGSKVAMSKVANLPKTADYPNGTVTTLSEDPVFVPNISINGFTARSMTIGLNAPPPELADYVHYYELEERKKNDPNSTKCADHVRDHRNLPYMFNNLDPHTTYVFRARACFDYGEKRCGNWSEEMEAVTLDGIPNEPSDVHIICDVLRDQYYQGYFMNLTWGPPKQPNAEIKGYMMEVTGNSSYIDRFGKMKLETFGPLSKFMTNQTLTVRVPDLKPNTGYTVRLMAMTRSRRRGQEKVVNCTTGYGPPDYAPRPKWRKVQEISGEEREESKYSLRVLVPRSPERNGPICCYRVYLVRLRPGQSWTSVPPPQDMKVITYHDAHGPRDPIFGAYITDVFNHKNFPKEELVLGDQNSINLTRKADNDTCARCFYRPSQKELPTTTVPAPTSTTDPDYSDPDSTEPTKTKRSADTRELLVEPYDGKLETSANYTLFVELIPGTDDESLYSGYTMALNTAVPPAIIAANTMEFALQICCAVAALLLLATLIFCVVHTRRARKHPPRHAHVELNPIQAALRYVVGHIGGRQQLSSQPPPDLPPIAIEDLAAAYAERQADSDYGFQKEFELLQMLPECYPDRTTHASEARENQPKNRYPDIKAYDQTRVKLSQIDGITGSDYINANYVMGYKEHKQFICAQGPTDTTVNDFWRMIWEHGLELIVMLTNLEEYSKVKCSKYWPDEVRGSRAFGSITVHHVSEKRYSDYIVRELKIVKQTTNSEGQPIVENNGVAKRNGDCKDAEGGSAPTSPREVKENNTRIVRQYHFLMWKDFAAPEHPQSILKFIKRMNEAWSHLMGRPVVVHCSAGVGRTGTLVALDCLLEQLRAARRAAVFSTVAELRRQRNFLVQSLKQYVFVYRALVEYAHYGDTEIPASRLKTSIDRLRNTPEGADKCLMEHEFEKMMNPPVSEPLKSCSAGAVEEARALNRSPDRLPYDRNRVILAPAPPLHFSTYINASFIEAYDNSEGYIITQDPLPNTIMDFWRMVSEHNVSTIVMLSELGEGKCPRYWDDGTAQYEHISVQYEESESCPYYTRRQFRVTNNKSGDVMSVRQLQYHGWPTAPGHVPEVTRGLASLADAARPLAAQAAPTCVVHCQYGTERSALFAALCILIAQLRTERRADVAAAARKVRSQRAGTINSFLQYEFLHRAILNYAELHNLLEDS